MKHISEQLSDIAMELRNRRDSEIMAASEVLAGYVQDHNDKQAYRNNERQVNRLAKAWDRMIALVERTEIQATRIENDFDNFYGD